VVEGVERDVDPAQAGLDERACEPVEQHAVRRQRQVAHTRRSREHADEHRELAANERLAAGQPHLVDSHRGEHGDQALKLFEGQHLVAPEPLETLGGHAVVAAEVALVGDRHAHAPDLAAPVVDERLHGESLA
jgi:hypothetical protein